MVGRDLNQCGVSFHWGGGWLTRLSARPMRLWHAEGYECALKGFIALKCDLDVVEVGGVIEGKKI